MDRLPNQNPELVWASSNHPWAKFTMNEARTQMGQPKHSRKDPLGLDHGRCSDRRMGIYGFGTKRYFVIATQQWLITNRVNGSRSHYGKNPQLTLETQRIFIEG